ncbi:DUF1330 domain-containing protein [Sphingomonas lacunae]|uniref:DUF1330 domain-containing protein n=1 Tax=Sphingomonas lacunae TaxID=2698828 RepID=A0A6M4AVU8_9SPHN|nr:DUF1330 domain-containing protein [Sphingomonas lacunae]QJQ32836.1 DUF1330 domain-containing protein [Sphingomonas lacunae]
MSGEAHIDPTRAAFDAFKALPRDEPIWMLNLVRYRDLADYPEGHALHGQGFSGAEAYRLYGEDSDPIFSRVGGKVVWRGAMQLMLTGPADEQWDTIFIAHYPTAGAFLAMVTDPDYREAVKHRQAAVLTSRLVRMQSLDTSGGFA